MKFVTDFNKEAVFFKGKEYTYKDLIKTSKYFSSLLNIEKMTKLCCLWKTDLNLFAAFSECGTAKVFL